MKNKQNIKNNQKNISINAGGDVNTGIINNQVDNSWYNIPKEDVILFDVFGKYLISKLGEKGGIFTSIILSILGLIITVINGLEYISNGMNLDFIESGEGLNFSKIIDNFTIEWFLTILGMFVFGLGVFIYRSIENKNNRECPKCKKPYSFNEVGTPKEKEVKTSKGYRITQVRNYACDNCKYKKTEEGYYLEPINN